MKLGKLEEQFVLMSKKAFDLIDFKGYETVDSSTYFVKRKARDESARKSYLKILDEINDGLYLRDLIRMEGNLYEKCL